MYFKVLNSHRAQINSCKMQNQNTENESSKFKGDVLERNVEHLFSVAKFKTSRNVNIRTYEIDVVAELGDRRIIIECKNYQNSSMTVRNLIHQWSSKNKVIGAHKVIIVIAGVTIKDSDKDLANSLDIAIWDEDDLGFLFKESLKPESFRSKLLENISLKAISISDRYRLEIMFELSSPAFSNSRKISDDIKFQQLTRWLRSYILTELEIGEIDRLTRVAHIELFEGSKNGEKGGFFGRKEKDTLGYWNALKSKMSATDLNNHQLEEDVRGRYLSYMYELERVWNELQTLFFESDIETRLNTQLNTRLLLALNNDSGFRFSPASNPNNEIEVVLLDEGYLIQVLRLEKKNADILEWILTSKYYLLDDPINPGVKRYSWYSGSRFDLIDKLSRILIEYFNHTENDMLLDTSVYRQVLIARGK